ncbi:MAG: FAD-dependent oxidoreductase [Alicyclobacillaceae bacterium]|uniref:FAD-dependent oxidoreductase n=1 Tax=Alicyclobacillus sp. SP_1 TaxID=2942475 RepID=UPI0021575A16|nr:FAD-dependent oxidoreductase [Alicyclobacillus sp. SP_1]MCY0896986.1 FAD-dependent oxidoreductase [Alicyclobacillaceae bacterium]
MYDVLVVGGGVAGLSVAMFTGKANLRTVVVDESESQLVKVKEIRNFPGVLGGISGEEWIASARRQAQSEGAELAFAKVTRFENVHGEYFSVHGVSVGGEALEWRCKYLVIAVNLGYALLAELGFEVRVNEHVPSGKIRFLDGVQYDGRTEVDRLYVAGLLANVPSQSVVSAGQGAFVGIQIASEVLGKPFMWHD